MEKEQRKSVNFDKHAEMNVYNDGWDDDFDDDSEDDQVVVGKTPAEIPQNKDKIVETIELNKVDTVELRNDGKQTYKIPVNNNSGPVRTSMRRGSMMRRRNTIYDPKPDDFSFDPTLGSPIEARVITDICCFMLFFVFVAIWAFSTCLVFNMGNLERFAIPWNAPPDKQLCGGEKQYLYRYEFNFNLIKCMNPLVAFRSCNTKSVCVEHCPKISFSFPFQKRQKNFSLSAKPSKEVIEAIQCIGTKPNFQSFSDIQKAISDSKCAEITPKSFVFDETDYKTLHHKCIPDLIETEIDFVIDILDDIVPQTNILWRITYEFARRIGVNDVGNSTSIPHKTMYTFSDMLVGWPVLIVFLVFALVLTLVMVYSMQFIAKFIFVIANSVNISLLIASIYKCIDRGYMFEEFSFNIFKNDVWFLFLVFTSVVTIIVLVQFILERRGTLIILELIKETTKAIEYIKTLLVFPLIFYCVRAATILASMYIGFTIKSTNEKDFKLETNIDDPACNCNGYKNLGFCNPIVITNCLFDFDSKNMSQCQMECKESDNQQLHSNLIGFSEQTNLLGYFWASDYLYLLEHAILASTFATYYWTFHKRDLPRFTLFNGFYTCIRYHLGTIFFAWLFLCVYSYIRFQFKLIDNLLDLLPFSIVHFFFKYIVIVMALCGDDFYDSAKEVISIVKTNARLIIISKCMSEILFFFVKLLITGVMGVLMYLVVLIFELIKPGYFKNDLFPVYIVCMGTYLLSTEIFNIYILGVDTFTFCYIEDISINNGDLESPFFMPRSLMRICNLKNKLDKASYDNHINLHSVK